MIEVDRPSLPASGLPAAASVSHSTVNAGASKVEIGSPPPVFLGPARELGYDCNDPLKKKGGR